MKIERILVEEREYVMGEIASFLCRIGISYVKVENEIHCPNLILRFYDFNTLQELIEIYNITTISDNLSVIGNEPLFLGLHDPSFLKRAFRLQREDFIGMIPKSVVHTIYPTPKNKKKQFRLENQKYMNKLK